MCYVCVCVYYYCWIDYYYSLIIVLFYSLDTRLCTVCSNNNKECCVEDCKVRRRSPEPACFYCMHHSDPSTRCRKCNRGLADGSGTLCSTCKLDDYSCQSDWKSIQAQVRKEMERHLKYGKLYPQLPRGKNELPFGVCKTKSDSYQVCIYFPLDKTCRYVGSFKLLKHTAQAAVYAKELMRLTHQKR